MTEKDIVRALIKKRKEHNYVIGSMERADEDEQILLFIDSMKESVHEDWKYSVAERLGISKEDFDKIDYDGIYGEEQRELQNAEIAEKDCKERHLDDILQRTKEDFSSVFPELKEESEDEKIRKELIEFVRNRGGFKQEWISWLEKQGEQPQGKSALEAVKEVKVDNQNCVKPTDKVEPKFRVGDWITNGIDFTFQIHSIKDNMYLRSDDYFIDIETADKKFRFWNIQDAKDGDVLVSDYEGGICITILKSVVSDNEIEMYCHSVNSELFIAQSGFSNATWHPATKEQCDSLMKAIADAGYTFDFDKKELKKIEQNTAENEELTEFDKAVGVTIGTWNPKTTEQIQSVKAVSKKLLKLAKKQINDEQKSSWSEEDKKMIGNIRRIIERYAFSKSAVDVNGELCEKVYIDDENWLKSLKDRVLPQKQEWSKEDEEMRNNLIGLLVRLSANSRTDSTSPIYCYPREIAWLKSLRPQNTWKPSGEQIEALLKLEEMHVLEHEKNQENAHLYMVVKSIREQLLKLREG